MSDDQTITLGLFQVALEDLRSPAGIQPGIPYPLSEALTREHDDDRHFVQYRLEGHPDRALPKIKKTGVVLAQLRSSGMNLVQHIFAFDWDSPGHAALSAPEFYSWMQALSTSGMPPPYAVYKTRNGARLIYRLSRPIPVDDAEANYRWLVNEFHKRNIPVDKKVCDWSRLFRLPKVVRDGQRTGADCCLHIFPENVLDIALLGRARSAQLVSRLSIEKPGPLPPLDDTEIFKSLKKRLKGKKCFPCIFEGADLAPRGQRDDTIYVYALELTNVVFHRKDGTPEIVYQLLLPAVQCLEPDTGTPDWTVPLWRAVTHAWSKLETEAQERAENTLSAEDRIIDGVLEWCDDDDTRIMLGARGEDSSTWIRRNAIAIAGGGYYVLGPNGYYDAIPLTRDHIATRVTELGMEEFVPLSRIQGDKVVDCSVPYLLRHHGVIARTVKGMPGPRLGGYMVTEGSDYKTFIEVLYARRRDLEPSWNSDVHLWMRHLFGEHLPLIEHWIGHALDFEGGPICALSIECGDGVGKKMLIAGLSECVEQEPAPATPQDLVSGFPEGLLRSPFLAVNEGWYKTRDDDSISELFRLYVSGEVPPVNRKFQSAMAVKNPVRIIITANNKETVLKVAGKGDLDARDRDAIARRLLHFDLTESGKQAQAFLAARGGARGITKGWIAGDGNQKSNYTLASHFLWLYENRKAPFPGSRFLVDGGNCPDLMREMRLRSGRSPVVLEIVLAMIEQIDTLHLPGVELDQDSNVWVTAAAVVQYFRDRISQHTKTDLTTRAVGHILKGISTTKDRRRYAGGERTYFYRLDLEDLLEKAEEEGWPCGKLNMIVRRFAR